MAGRGEVLGGELPSVDHLIRATSPVKTANQCTKSSFSTKNIFDLLHDLIGVIRETRRPQLDAADGLAEPITHDLHHLVVELLENPELLSLHAACQPGCRRQLHPKVAARCG